MSARNLVCIKYMLSKYGLIILYTKKKRNLDKLSTKNWKFCRNQFKLNLNIKLILAKINHTQFKISSIYIYLTLRDINSLKN